MKWIKKYRVFLIASLAIVIMFFWNREMGLEAIETVQFSFKEMITILPPVFILMGLLDVWVPKDTMVRFMGDDSGLIGILLSFFLGSAAAGPLYGAFPIAAVFTRKGVKFSNVLIFIGAWSTTKIPMILFEVASMGTKFAMTRFIVNIFGILFIAYIVNKSLSKEEIQEIYNNAENMDQIE